MAKVEMNLVEYNEMRDELLFYKALIQKLTTASLDAYYYEKLTEGTYSCITAHTDVDDLSNSQKDFLRSMVEENLPEEFKKLISTGDYIIDIPYNLFHMNLCEITRVEKGEVNEES